VRHRAFRNDRRLYRRNGSGHGPRVLNEERLVVIPSREDGEESGA
jgi:hypothetical protein